jgi:peptidoglycan/LPS O-acetylase OafA/YrhL
MLFVMITITASYLNLAAAENPWSMEVQFSNFIVMLVLLGSCLCDTFFTISGFLAFYSIHKIYLRNGNQLSLGDVLKLYLKRYLRLAPVAFATLFFGIYIMPFIHGDQDDKNDPVWFSFFEVLFYRCRSKEMILSKIFFYSNLSPIFQDDKDTCMGWSWFYESEMQLFLLTPLCVIFYEKAGKRASYLLFTALICVGVYVNYASSYKYHISAGIFSIENYFMYSYFINKPWYKIPVYFLGMICGVFFVDIREY